MSRCKIFQSEIFGGEFFIELLKISIRGVVPGVAGGAMALPDFGRSVNPISTRGRDVTMRKS